jgi:hypothetical protein
MSIVSDPNHPAALLKADDKTWSMRQKNTSNALMVLQSSSETPNDGVTGGEGAGEGGGEGNADGDGDGDDGKKNNGEGLDVVSTVHETYELVPEEQDQKQPQVRQKGPPISTAKHSGSKGKWHERFGKNR